MANQELLDILKQGIHIWNRWRRQHPAAGIKLNKADLREVDLSGADLHEAYLMEADLFGANLSGANLSGADLYKALQLHLFGGRLAEDPFGEELRSLIRAKAHGIAVWQPSVPGGQWSDAPCCQERTRIGDHGYDDRPSSKTGPCCDRCLNALVVPRSGMPTSCATRS